MPKKPTTVTLFFIASLLTIGLVAGGIFIYKQYISSSSDDTATHEELISAIVQDSPALKPNDEPIISIDSIVQNDGWYIVTIKSLNSTNDIASVRVVLEEISEGLRVVMGPDTYFPIRELLSFNLPDWVMMELQE